MPLDYTSSVDEQVAYYDGLRQRYEDACKLLGATHHGDITDALYRLSKMVTGAVKVAPFKRGQRIELIDAPEIPKESGWYGHRHVIVNGATAIVHSIQLDQDGWCIWVKFDNDSWIGYDGKVNPIAEADRSLFGFRPGRWRAVSSPTVSDRDPGDEQTGDKS